jgi:hypothetical protein
VKNLIRNVKQSFERGIAKGCGSDQANKKKFFSYIKQKTKCRPSVGPLKDARGKILQDDGEVAELLRRFFSSVFASEDTTNISDQEPTDCREEIKEVKITEKDVKAKFKKLRADGAAGPEGMGPLLLQKLVEEISWPLAKVMQASLQEGAVPEKWRTANVTLIFKKGSKTDPGNYRPVSLTSVSGRLMESVVKDQMVKHLEKNGLVRNGWQVLYQQSSCFFRKSDGCIGQK